MPSYAAEKALQTVAQKVAELQNAIMDLASVFETNEFGLEEWCDDLSVCYDDLHQEVMAEEDDE